MTAVHVFSALLVVILLLFSPRFCDADTDASSRHLRSPTSSALMPFPRVGRSGEHETLAAMLGGKRALQAGLFPFPRVGRSDIPASAWCLDCAPSELQHQMMRREGLMAFPRVGKRQGLVAFPRIGRARVSVEGEEEDDGVSARLLALLKAAAQHNKRGGGDDVGEDPNLPQGSGLWFGPRLGRNKRELGVQEVEADALPYSFYAIKDLNERDQSSSEKNDEMLGTSGERERRSASLRHLSAPALHH